MWKTGNDLTELKKKKSPDELKYIIFIVFKLPIDFHLYFGRMQIRSGISERANSGKQ